MSTVFASDVGGWDDYSDYGGFRQIPVNSCINIDGNEEGSDERPSSYVDIESTPEVYFAQKRYESFQQKKFEDNIELVKECMMLGVVLPSKTVIPQIINKLKMIANGGV